MSAPFKVLLYESMHPQGTEVLQRRCQLVYASSLNEADLIRQAADVEAIILRANGAVTRGIIDAAPRLKVIGRHGVGLDSIDLQAARDNQIRVVYTPTANTESVAEHFVALALTLAKKIRLGDAALRANRWSVRNQLIGTEMHGKTLGVLGFGRIGQQTARICHQGFDMPVIYYDEEAYPQPETELSARKLDLEEVFAQSDFLSINLPLLPTTRHLVNASRLHLMKPTAFLINMARGPVWREEDVIKALEENWIAGVGSDVFETEPISPDNPLLRLENFVGTPHMAAHSEESMRRMSMVGRDVLRVLEGEEPEYPVL